MEREFKLARGSLSNSGHEGRIVWLASIGAVALSLAILLFIGYGPQSAVHRAGPALIWALALIVVCALGIDLMAVRSNLSRVRHDLTFVLDENALIRRRQGYAEVRISLPEIKSLYERSACLVVEGGQPPRRIAVPKNVENFDLLRTEVAKYCSLMPAPRHLKLRWITLLITVVCWSLLIWPANTGSAQIASGAVLVLLAWESFRLRRGMLRNLRPVPFWILIGLAWLAAGFLIYMRAFRVS